MVNAKMGVALAAVAILFGGDLASLFKLRAAEQEATNPLPGQEGVDRLSIGGKIHISFCSS